jgi:hypothetical protein
MVKHIFGEQYEFGLDYIQLLYTRPERILPILLLQSVLRGTGKSTFAQWLIDIFQHNAVKLGNADMESEFNSTYAERLLVVVDETALSKKVTSEAIKKMSTEQGKIWVNAKGRQQYEVDWIGKFVFCTNNENTSLYVGKGETRYFVRTVQMFNQEDNRFDQKLRDEIPAFLYFLHNRQLYHADESRMYFNFSVYKTPELIDTIEANRSIVEKEIEQFVIDYFEMFPNEELLHVSVKDIFDQIKERSRYISPTDISRHLKHEFKIESKVSQRYCFNSLIAAATTDDVMAISQRRNGRPFVFENPNIKKVQ